MTDWIYHTPKQDGDAPEGFNYVLHELNFRHPNSGVWGLVNSDRLLYGVKYRYRLREGLEQAVRELWSRQGHEIPPLPRIHGSVRGRIITHLSERELIEMMIGAVEARLLTYETTQHGDEEELNYWKAKLEELDNG